MQGWRARLTLPFVNIVMWWGPGADCRLLAFVFLPVARWAGTWRFHALRPIGRREGVHARRAGPNHHYQPLPIALLDRLNG